MLQRARAFAAICRTTFMETIQEPAVLLVMLVAVVVALLMPLFHFHAFDEEGRLARDSGMAAAMVFGLVLGAASASAAITREAESGTAASTLAKPVGRGLFLWAKAGGVAAVVTIFWAAVVLATMLAESADLRFIEFEEVWDRVADVRLRQWSLAAPALALALAALLNHRWRLRFGTCAFLLIPLLLAVVAAGSGLWEHSGLWGGYKCRLNWTMVTAALPLLFALVLLTCWSTALAVRLPGAIVLLCGAVLLALGLSADLWSGGVPAWSWRGIAGGLLPNIQHYWLADALADSGRVPWGYVWRSALHAATGSAIALLAGQELLRYRDIG